MTRSYTLAVVPGDGIGPEVTTQALTVLNTVAAQHDLSFDTVDYDLGARRYHATGETLPDSVLEEIRGQDAILLGAVGDPSVPSGVLERGLLLRLRFELDHYVNLRPSTLSAAPSASARRTSWPRRSASTRRTASSASCATRSPGPRRDRAAS